MPDFSLGPLLRFLFAASVLGLTLGIWKLVEIVWWVVSHVRWE